MLDEFEPILSSLVDLLQVDLLVIMMPVNDRLRFVPAATHGVSLSAISDFELAIDDSTYHVLTGNAGTDNILDVRWSFASPLDHVEGVSSVTTLPLVMRARLLGLLQIGWRGVERLPPDARLLHFAGEYAATAVDRLTLQRVLSSARSTTAYSRERLNFLAITSALLSSSLDYETTLSQVTSMLVPKLADVCGVVIIDDDGNATEVTTDSIDPQITRKVREMQSRYSLRLDARSGVRRVLNTGRTEFHPYVDEAYYERIAINEENVELLKAVGMRSILIVPLNVRGKTIGALSLAYVRPDNYYTLEEVDFIEELAQRAAMAVENARLFDKSQRALLEREEALRFREETLRSERLARARAEASQRREAFLAEASNVLASSLDYSLTLENLVRLVVPQVADWCIIDLFDDTGTSSVVAFAHRDADSEQIMSQLRDSFSPVALPELPPRHVLRYRKPTLLGNVPGDFWSDSATEPGQRAMLEQIKTSSLMVIPLFVRDRTLGVVLFGRAPGSASFDSDDFALAVDLGYRAALAIDNSELYNSAQEVLRLQEEFISTASHELKTPLTTVKGYLQLINRQLYREDQSPARIGRFTREMEQQVRRLEDLVSDLLDVSRIQQGRVELRLEQFDLAELAANVLSRFEYAQERTAQHELLCEAPEPVEGIWDRGRVDQVLTNLISNAIKYSPDGGQVHVRVRRVGDVAQMTVRDTGIGITREERAKLFQPFVRGENVRREITGTGLGLYITRRIVQNHRGTISVKSEPGRGSTFTVRLPLNPRSNDE
jgi:signal transduction histidine kinase